MAFHYDLSEYVASTWTMYNAPVLDAIDACHKYGFDCIEIWADLCHLDPRVKPDIDEIKRHIKANGQLVHSIHLPIQHPFDHPEDDKEFFEYRLALQKQVLDWAEQIGCTIGVLHTFDPHFYRYSLNRMDELRQRLGLIVDYAGERGVRIAVENMPYRPEGRDMTTTLAAQSEYFKGLNIYYCLDIGHVPLLNESDCIKEIDAVHDRLITFHVHNNYGKKDDHNMPNDGILDWPDIHDHARAAGYNGKFVLEVNERSNGEEVLRRLASLANQNDKMRE